MSRRAFAAKRSALRRETEISRALSGNWCSITLTVPALPLSKYSCSDTRDKDEPCSGNNRKELLVTAGLRSG